MEASPAVVARLPVLLLAQADPPRHAWLDVRTGVLLAVVLGLLGIAYGAGEYLRRLPESSVNPGMVRAFSLRVRAWWMMCAILTAAFLFQGPTATVVLFGLVSFWALREFITLTPTRMGDHRALFWVFFLFTPLQYVLVGLGIEYYGLYSIVVPVYGFLFIPARVALAGDYKRFLERTAKIQAGLLVCVYSLSYAPALLYLELQTAAGPWRGTNPGLLFFFILLVQLNDVLQYLWGKLLGKRVIAPAISASKTWEGFCGGVLSTTLLGTVLWWVTPFTPWQAAIMALIIAIMGSAGSMTMSAIKRDRGVKDYGTLVEGHAGVLDRIDSICFAAPVFFHITRYYFTAV
jgi:phosphatidate cytidylyltransferase